MAIGKVEGKHHSTQVTANIALQAEISERLLVEKELSQQREFLQGIIESLTHPFYVIDAETYAIVLANGAAYALSNRPRKNLTCYGMTHDRDTPCSGNDHVCALAMVKKHKKPITVEHVHYDHDGGGRYFEIHAYPLLNDDGVVKHVIEYNIDVTERRKAEEERKAMWAQLLQSQKMEAVGLLAGGVAHDFNNILTAIVGNVQLAMLKSGAATDDVNNHLDQILNSSNRAAGLVRQLLLFSRRQSAESFSPVNLNETTTNLLPMLRRLIGEDITISADLAHEIWAINGDEGSIEQLLTNLIVNARDAMPDGGEIVITTKNIGIDGNLEKQIHNARPGDYVALSIADTGSGIAKQDLDRIFDPFYTSKPEGKGTGLGLSIVSGIVTQHDGWINVYSEQGKGSIFNIYLPAVTGKEGRETVEPAAGWDNSERGAINGNGRLVLLLEDENDVRQVAQRMLEGKGFRVMAAADIDAARKIFARERDNIDLLFSDVALPDGNGVKLARELLGQAPQLKVLMTSGYPDHRSRLDMIRERKLRFVQKPYGVRELSRALAETLSD